MFKPDMIQDPWQQLAQKLVPKGLLSAQELNNSFCPKIVTPKVIDNGIQKVAEKSMKSDPSDSFGDNFLVYSHHQRLKEEDNEEEIDIDEDDET